MEPTYGVDTMILVPLALILIRNVVSTVSQAGKIAKCPMLLSGDNLLIIKTLRDKIKILRDGGWYQC